MKSATSGRTRINDKSGRKILIASILAAAGMLWLASSALPQQAPATRAGAPRIDEAARNAAIRTPAAPATPQINGTRIFGAKPGHPFFFHVPATGNRPMQFSADGLPSGLKIDADTGNITGAVADKGTFKVTLTASNSMGKNSAPLTVQISDAICLTPPMGWNSWNFFHGNVKDSDIRGATDSMVKTDLIDHGWTYINIDDTWESQDGNGRDAEGHILTNSKFPDMKALADYVHSQGLKFGIYSSPGPLTCAKYPASWQHEDQDAQTYADWGVDYVKYDWCSYSTIAAQRTMEEYAKVLSPEDATKLKELIAQRAAIPRQLAPPAARTAPAAPPSTGPTTASLTREINAIEAKIDPDTKKKIDLKILQEPYEHFHQSLLKVNRDIVYSLCQYGNGDVWNWGADVGGNVWRVTGDISPTWARMSGFAFGATPLKDQPFNDPSHFNDPDMLEVGNGNLTPDENFTHMTQWCMLAAPLLIGCDMPHMDAFVTSLFSNDEVLAIDQDPLGKQATRLSQSADKTQEIWTKPLADGTWAVALYNTGAEPQTISVSWSDLKLLGAQPVRDLWRQKDVTPTADGVSVSVAPHGVEMFRIGKPQM